MAAATTTLGETALSSRNGLMMDIDIEAFLSHARWNMQFMVSKMEISVEVSESSGDLRSLKCTDHITLSSEICTWPGIFTN